MSTFVSSTDSEISGRIKDLTDCAILGRAKALGVAGGNFSGVLLESCLKLPLVFLVANLQNLPPLQASGFICGARVFTKLDLQSAYNLVRVRAGDEWKTAFVTPTGHYEYRVMPYGLSISPSVFQTFMNEVFREFLHRFVVVYVDDILIYSRNQAEHLTFILIPGVNRA
ncbi:Transposon Tf2-8 polyprotein [Labeo rohita]|uniref:ribonuclease H n=1 Tax=Labeo rohita TaxID=84645 RepID=A0ABQ8L6T0_LABRO|nr:Transposon Tf2-8 polyprotein [Labeo rohita]